DALEHTKANKITYPFVNFEGDLAEQALLHALDQTATPTYLIIDRQNTLKVILAGTPSLKSWLQKNTANTPQSIPK
ncbi:MAG: hypothetical protein V2I33_10520, partial [Kangiellaceae bacterium]|nr:hypothetical protein [Kangiellaceae bacterium]